MVKSDSCLLVSEVHVYIEKRLSVILDLIEDILLLNHNLRVFLLGTSNEFVVGSRGWLGSLSGRVLTFCSCSFLDIDRLSLRRSS